MRRGSEARRVNYCVRLRAAGEQARRRAGSFDVGAVWDSSKYQVAGRMGIFQLKSLPHGGTEANVWDPSRLRGVRFDSLGIEQQQQQQQRSSYNKASGRSRVVQISAVRSGTAGQPVSPQVTFQRKARSRQGRSRHVEAEQSRAEQSMA
jgi:hypothetical protein